MATVKGPFQIGCIRCSQDSSIPIDTLLNYWPLLKTGSALVMLTMLGGGGGELARESPSSVYIIISINIHVYWNKIDIKKQQTNENND